MQGSDKSRGNRPPFDCRTQAFPTLIWMQNPVCIKHLWTSLRHILEQWKDLTGPLSQVTGGSYLHSPHFTSFFLPENTQISVGRRGGSLRKELQPKRGITGFFLVSNCFFLEFVTCFGWVLEARLHVLPSISSFVCKYPIFRRAFLESSNLIQVLPAVLSQGTLHCVYHIHNYILIS